MLGFEGYLEIAINETSFPYKFMMQICNPLSISGLDFFIGAWITSHIR